MTTIGFTDTSGTETYAAEVGSGKSFSITSSYKTVVFGIEIKKGITVTNLTWYPMVRYSDITDSTYEPYRLNVKNEIDGIKNDVDSIDDSIGYRRKNLFKMNEQPDTKFNGITHIKILNYGAIKFSGTCTESFTFFLGSVYLEPGTYVISGQAIAYVIGDTTTDVASSKTITLTEGTTVNLIKWFNKDSTYDTTIYPMIRYASTDSTFEPYSENMASIVERQTTALGCRLSKNLLRPTITEGVYSGITYKRNSNNSVTVNGTNTNTTGSTFIRIGDIAAHKILGKKIIISGFKGLRYQLDGRNENNGQVYAITTSDSECTLIPHNNVHLFRLHLSVPPSATIDNVTIYPMIRYADIEDGSYEVYKPSISDNLSEVSSTLGYTCRNLFRVTCSSETIKGVVVTVDANKRVTAKGTTTGSFTKILDPDHLTRGNMRFNKPVFIRGADRLINCVYIASIITSDGTTTYQSIGVDGLHVPVGSTIRYLYLQQQITDRAVDATLYPMIVYDEIEDKTYEPFRYDIEKFMMYEHAYNGVRNEATIASGSCTEAGYIIGSESTYGYIMYNTLHSGHTYILSYRQTATTGKSKLMLFGNPYTTSGSEQTPTYTIEFDNATEMIVEFKPSSNSNSNYYCGYKLYSDTATTVSNLSIVNKEYWNTPMYSSWRMSNYNLTLAEIDTRNRIGKNCLDLKTSQTYVMSGITIVVDHIAGTITVSGKSTSSDIIFSNVNTHWSANHTMYLKSGRYIYTSGATSDQCLVDIRDDTSTGNVFVQNCGIWDHTGRNIRVCVRIVPNAEITEPIVFKPMIRPQFIISDSFEPYYGPYNKIQQINNDIKAIGTSVGRTSNNILNIFDARDVNNTIITQNSENSYTFTSTGTWSRWYCRASVIPNKPYKIIYKIPARTSVTPGVFLVNGGIGTSICWLECGIGTGHYSKTFTPDSDSIELRICVNNSGSVDTGYITFEDLIIVPADSTDLSYTSYNASLDDRMRRLENLDNSKNLLKPLLTPGKTYMLPNNEVKVTVNPDYSLTSEVLSTITSSLGLHINFSKITLNPGMYTYTVGGNLKSTTATHTQVYCIENDSEKYLFNITTPVYTMMVDKTTTYIFKRVLGANNEVGSVLRIYPMLRKANITDSKYVPYAPSYKDMYENEFKTLIASNNRILINGRYCSIRIKGLDTAANEKRGYIKIIASSIFTTDTAREIIFKVSSYTGKPVGPAIIRGYQENGSIYSMYYVYDSSTQTTTYTLDLGSDNAKGSASIQAPYDFIHDHVKITKGDTNVTSTTSGVAKLECRPDIYYIDQKKIAEVTASTNTTTITYTNLFKYHTYAVFDFRNFTTSNGDKISFTLTVPLKYVKAQGTSGSIVLSCGYTSNDVKVDGGTRIVFQCVDDNNIKILPADNNKSTITSLGTIRIYSVLH